MRILLCVLWGCVSSMPIASKCEGVCMKELLCVVWGCVVWGCVMCESPWQWVQTSKFVQFKLFLRSRLSLKENKSQTGSWSECGCEGRVCVVWGCVWSVKCECGCVVWLWVWGCVWSEGVYGVTHYTGTTRITRFKGSPMIDRFTKERKTKNVNLLWVNICACFFCCCWQFCFLSNKILLAFHK